MSVQYTRLTAATTIAQLGTTLHANLIAAGWTIEYADSDAIGSGSASNPAWDKTPAANTTAGRAIYRMPASGSLYRWYVQVEFRWASNTNIGLLQVRSGTGVTSGTLDNISATWGVTAIAASNQNLTATEHFVVAYAHGFLVFINAAFTGWLVSFERARTLTNDLLNDHVVFTQVGAGTGNITISPPNQIGSVVRRGEGAYETYAARTAIVLATLDNNSTWATATSTVDAAGNGYPVGPYSQSNGLGGLPRLFLLMLPSDATAGNFITFAVDGANRQYRVAAVSLHDIFDFAVATE